jgi:hypothetical protein
VNLIKDLDWFTLKGPPEARQDGAGSSANKVFGDAYVEITELDVRWRNR